MMNLEHTRFGEVGEVSEFFSHFISCLHDRRVYYWLILTNYYHYFFIILGVFY